MNKELMTKAEEMVLKLREDTHQKGFSANFEIYTNGHGGNFGEVYIVKEKPNGEVVIYTIPKD